MHGSFSLYPFKINFFVSNRDSNFTGPPAMPIPYEQHKKLKSRRGKVRFELVNLLRC